AHTIRKMKNDFRKMEDEMDRLATNMAVITDFSARISATLQDRHERITKLAGVHALLRKLQFLFELPSRLTKCVELGAYGQAQYQHLPSFRAIQDDCQVITARLAQQLRQRFREGGSGAPEQAECVELLLALGEPAEELCEEFLAHARGRLEEELSSLEAELGPSPPAPDVLEFTDRGGSGFVGGLCQVAAAFQELFAAQGPAGAEKLAAFARELGGRYFALTATISYILTLTDEQFLVQVNFCDTCQYTVCRGQGAARRLLTHYVKVQGLVISQMLRKSVETRDWLSTLEPRNVRAVMKRVVEDTTAIDVQVGLLYEEGVRKAQSSDSSKRTFSVYSSSRQQGRYAPSYTPSAPMDTNLLSNIQKLFSERIDVFSPVEFNKVSVLTGIIKISLKTLLECVRLRTFGRFGLQQVQVDCHFLQLYLWRFVADEELVHLLLDEVVASAALRCPDPVPMEPSVVEVICERG
uniref:Vacuolar protein sorting-associated protein 51 homolog n=1 Tax=Sciurus vulgaris TaxID=55149 RepID=A0A8D2CTS4_SCIVU